VTTARCSWSAVLSEIANGFDQDAAIVALARWYLYKVVFEPKTNLRQWFDRLLIRWASCFAEYQKGNTNSFVLPNTMKYLPQYMYHFRRNPVFRRSGLTPDQLTYHTHALNR
jgi:protein transport protein SEC23